VADPFWVGVAQLQRGRDPNRLQARGNAAGKAPQIGQLQLGERGEVQRAVQVVIGRGGEAAGGGRTDQRDVFLCHAWDDRQGSAKELHDLLEASGVKVWFSEKDIALGEPFLREIDGGLAKSRVGIVLVTPNFLKRIHGRSIADKKLSVLLHGGKLVPIIHGTTFAALNNESPMLASRNGLSTAEDSMADVASKLADLVAV
jgi:hypothetical protein